MEKYDWGGGGVNYELLIIYTISCPDVKKKGLQRVEGVVILLIGLRQKVLY